MNFPQEILDIILAHNDQYEIDWRVNQFASLGVVRKCFDKRGGAGRTGTLPYCSGAHGVGGELKAFAEACERKKRNLKPSALKFKYVRKETDVWGVISGAKHYKEAIKKTIRN